MTKPELDAIRDRLTGITPGPWGTIPPGGPGGPFWGICNRMGNIVAMRLTDRQGDATFIAYARDDVPLLLAEVERLRRQIQDAFVDGVFWAMEGHPTDDTIADWRAEAERRWPLARAA